MLGVKKQLILISFFLFPCFSFASWNDPKEFAAWEKKALDELRSISPLPIDKEFTIFMIAGRELSSYGFKDKAIEYYLKAYQHKSKLDKTEAVIQLISLNLKNKDELKNGLNRSKEWFTKNPKNLTNELDSWLKMIEGYVEGKTPIVGTGFFSVWATDARVDELIQEGNSLEALRVIGPRELKNANINLKVRQDILNNSVFGKRSPPLWCEKTLEKYPTSMTWTMRVCRYLKDFKAGKKSSESITTIRDQMELEKTPHMIWLKILEKI
jgi:hypothetical protein